MLLKLLLTALLPWSKRLLLSNLHTTSWLEHDQETKEGSLTGVRLLFYSLSPRLAVEVAVAYGLGEVVCLDGGDTLEVGDGAGETEDAVVGTS